MLTLFSIITLGFVLGMRHALDPDHVVAVTTIVSRQPSVRRAAWIGALWGVGHTLTITLVGSAIILFNLVIPTALELSMELAVGLMLVVLGAINVGGVVRSIGGAVPDRRAARDAPPAAASIEGDHVVAGSRLRQFARPVVVGIVHGLAGSAAVALLVLATIQHAGWAVLYLVVYGIGTIAGMVVVTMAMAAPFAAGGAPSTVTRHRLQAATGALSIALGLLLAYKIGFVDGLFVAG